MGKSKLIQSLIEEIYIEEAKTQYINIKGWAFYTKSNAQYTILIKTDNKIILEKAPNVERKDVVSHYNLDNDKIKCGFEYKIELVDKNPNNLEVLLKEKQDIISIGKFLYRDLKKINLIIKYNIENVTLSYTGNKKYVNLYGWAFSEKTSDQIKLILKDGKNKELARLESNQFREDVKKVFSNKEIPLLCGFEHAVNIARNCNTLSIELEDSLGNKNIAANINLSLVPINGEKPYTILDIVYNKKKYFYENTKLVFRLLTKGWKILKYRHNFRPSLYDIRMYYYKAKNQLETNKRKINHLSHGIQIPPKIETYKTWISNNSLSINTIKLLREYEKRFKYRPLISIVMPVYNVKEEWFEKAVNSVINQIYTNWELCIVDDASTQEHIKGMLNNVSSKDNRIKVTYRKENGNISLATNTAAEMASGEYILLMDNDDELSINALYEIIRLLQTNPEADIIYSDDDKIDENGNRYAPQFKPDWSPELLLSYMYFSHLFCVRKSLFWKVGGLRKGFEGAQDYDLALRVTELTSNIYHIPKILYHWRAIIGSTAQSGESKPEAFIRGQIAIEEALKRRGINNAIVNRPDFAVKGHLGIYEINWPDEGPKVTIIIPTKNQYELLKRCIDSLKKTSYRNYEVMVIDNGSDDPQTMNYLSALEHRVEKILNRNGKFSYAHINNEAVKKTNSEYLLFLNNDTEVINPDWLSALVGYSSIDGIGIAGARLVYPDNRIQHAGIVMGLYDGMAGPAFKLLPEWSLGYLGYARVARNYSAVTAACLLIKKKDFENLNGFDEVNFAVAYNDVDLCLRMRACGKRIVYVPNASLKHYEGASRGFSDNIDELIAFRKKYKEYCDPYYNINLSKANEQFQVSINSTLDYFKEINRKPKVLMVGFNLNFEGAPFSQYEITMGLLEKNSFHIEIYCPTDGPLRQYYEKEKIPVHLFEHPLNGVYTLEQYDKALEKFTSWLKEKEFDVIYANTLQCFYIVDAAYRAGIPSIWNIRESASYQEYFDFLPSQIKHKGIECFRYPYKLIFVADATKILYEDLNNKDAFLVIKNGLKRRKIEEYCKLVTSEKAKEKLGILKYKKMVLIVGTVCERKGQKDFVQAAVNCIKSGMKDTVYYVVGARKSAYLDEIKAIINENNMEAYIRLVDETNEVYDYYRAADIFVCSSYNESYPRVILEAMAFGLPIITTPVFGIREQVIENVNAIFYEPGNIVDLTKKLETLLKNQTLSSSYALNSPKVLEFINSYEEMVDKYEKELMTAWMSKNN